MTFSEPMRHLFGKHAYHIYLWGIWFPNCPVYFGQFENDEYCVLSDFWLMYLMMSMISAA
jgi:hypothetical protein